MAKRGFKNGKTSQTFSGYFGYVDDLVLRADVGVCGSTIYFGEAE
jgi:hypothetical protein